MDYSNFSNIFSYFFSWAYVQTPLKRIIHNGSGRIRYNLSFKCPRCHKLFRKKSVKFTIFTTKMGFKMKDRETKEILDYDRTHLWHPYTSMKQPLSVFHAVRADGVHIELSDGRRIVDGMSSWWSGDPRIQ